MDAALLILRVVVGLYMVAHGAQKWFGWFGGPGFTGAQSAIGRLGYRPARVWTLIMCVAEVGGGLLLAIGLLTPIAAIGVAANMLSATIVPHWSKGPFNANGGYEQPLTNLAVAVSIGLAGPGAYSLDNLLGIHVPVLYSVVIALIALVAVVLGIISRRGPSAQEQPQTLPKAA